MIRALSLLLAFELVGEALRAAAHLPVPGPVVGMLLLAVALIARQQNAEESADETQLLSNLARVSDALISHMGLLFVPAGVGVVAEVGLLRTEWLPIVIGLVGSTLLSLVVTSVVMQRTLANPDAGRNHPVDFGDQK